MAPATFVCGGALPAAGARPSAPPLVSDGGTDDEGPERSGDRRVGGGGDLLAQPTCLGVSVLQ